VCVKIVVRKQRCCHAQYKHASFHTTVLPEEKNVRVQLHKTKSMTGTDAVTRREKLARLEGIQTGCISDSSASAVRVMGVPLETPCRSVSPEHERKGFAPMVTDTTVLLW
jgi:hypothetical protein